MEKYFIKNVTHLNICRFWTTGQTIVGICGRQTVMASLICDILLGKLMIQKVIYTLIDDKNNKLQP